MKKIYKIIALLFLVLIASMAYVWFFVYNKPHRDFEKATPEYQLTAKKCYNDFLLNKNRYTGKVIQIEGVASKLEQNDSLAVLVFVFDQGMFGDEGIRCTLLPKYIGKLHHSDYSHPIKIKGFCSGYNDTDVIMEHCSIVH